MSRALLSKFSSELNVAVVGAPGGLGQAFAEHFTIQPNVEKIHTSPRIQMQFGNEQVESHKMDIQSEQSTQEALNDIGNAILFDIVVVAIGSVHAEHAPPYKTIRDVNIDNFHNIFSVYTYVPALLAKYFLSRRIEAGKRVRHEH